MRIRALIVTVAALVAGGLFAIPGAPPATASIDPAQFTSPVANPYFPLKPGTVFVYRGTEGRQTLIEHLRVTHRTRKIEGVPCVAVSDRLYLLGRLEERTTDWYTQDSRGNVWYFGENTAELDAHGHIKSTEGTWAAGVHGAKPGIYIPGHPRLGQSALQEFYKGHAEDHFRVIGLFRTVVGGRLTSTLLTKEWTPLEPGVLDHKMYVRGIGTVLEQSQHGADERNELISIGR